MVALADAIKRGRVPGAKIALVLSDEAGAKGLEHAVKRGIETLVVKRGKLTREAHEKVMIDALEARGIELVCLAGFMRRLSPRFIEVFRGRILNIHPSLLPAFPGLHAQRQAIDHGVKVSGCTVHFVDETLDGGHIILQRAVPVLDDDTPETLAERILSEEHRAYAEAVKLVVSKAYKIEGRSVVRKTTTAAKEESVLGMEEFKIYVDLYKFFLKLCLSVNVFYLGLLGGFLTLLFRPADKEPGNLLTFVFSTPANPQGNRLIDTLTPPAVKVVLLVTPFIIGYVLMLAFAMGGAYWWVSTLEINKHIKKKSIEKKNVKVKLVTTPFFHLLTFLLIAVTIILMFVAYFLGTIMAQYDILFCTRCRLPGLSLEGIIIIPLVIIVVLLLVIIKRRSIGMR